MAVGSTRLRWRGKAPTAAKDEAEQSQMRLMELAFRMGQSSCSAPSSAASSQPIQPRVPLLALEDKKDGIEKNDACLCVHLCTS